MNYYLSIYCCILVAKFIPPPSAAVLLPVYTHTYCNMHINPPDFVLSCALALEVDDDAACSMMILGNAVFIPVYGWHDEDSPI